MQCRYCRHEIEVGQYIRYKGMPFCCSECLGDYLIDQIPDEEIDYDVWHTTPDNEFINAMEDKAAVRKDVWG